MVADFDRVERSNLPRQPWYSEDDLGELKAAVLARKLGGRVTACVAKVDERFAWPQVDVVLDGTDNWDARAVIERHARNEQIPWVFASAVRWEGQTAWMDAAGPCLKCLFGPTLLEGLRCFEAGVVNMVTLAVAGQALWLVERWLTDPASPDLHRLYLLEGREASLWSVGLPQRRCEHDRG